MTAPRILIVIESINIEDSSGTKGRVALIRNLQNSGFELKVYHYTRRTADIMGVDCVPIPERRRTFMYGLSKLQVLLWRLFKINVNPFFEKRFGFTFSFYNDVYSIKKALQKKTKFQPDWVLTLSKAASFRTHKALLELPNWHSKWLAYVHDPFPHHFYPRPYNWVEPGYYQKQEFFREVSKKAAHSVFPSQLLMEWMGSYYPDFIERGIVIPHQISNDSIQMISPPCYFKKDGFTILHAGSLMKPRNPQGLVEAFELFLKRTPKAKAEAQLLFLGSKSYFETYLKEKQEQINQIYLSSGYVQYSDVEVMQQLVSVNVILEANSEISPFLPGKFPHCVKANKPILYLGPQLSECSRLLGHGYIYKAEIDQVNTIANHLCNLYKYWKNDSKNKFLNRPDLEDYMSPSNLKKIMSQLNT